MKNPFISQFWLRFMRFTLTQIVVSVLFLSISYAHKMHAQDFMNQRLTLNFQGTEIKKVLQRIEKSTQVQFMYSSNVLQNNRKVSVTVNNERLSDVLENLLTPLQVSYEVEGNRILLKRSKAENTSSTPLHSFLLDKESLVDQQVSGKVMDENGGGLPGVSVVAKGTNKGTSTDATGSYTLTVPDGATTLIYSFVGYVSQEVVLGNRTKIDITLKVDVKALSEVMVHKTAKM